MGYKTNKLAINTDFSDDFNIDASGDVNIDGSLFLWGTEFKDTDEFTGLSDTPSSYSGQATSVVSVNAGGSGLEFKETTPIYIEVEDISTSNIPLAGTYLNGDGSWTSIDTGGGSFLSLSDTPSIYTGFANSVVSVDNDASALEFTQTVELYVEVTDISAAGTASSTTYLRGDGNWAAVESGGVSFSTQYRIPSMNSDGSDFTYVQNSNALTFDGYKLGLNNARGVLIGGTIGNSTTHTSGSTIGIGSNTLISLTSGASNIAVGNTNSSKLTTGGSNLILGNNSGNSLATGIRNVILGNSAGEKVTASNNTIIGTYSGSNTTGGNNVLIGYRAGIWDEVSNKLIIDSLQRNNISEQQNESLIYGTFDGTASNQLIRLNSQFELPHIAESSTNQVLYYNTSSGKVTYADAPSGGDTTSVTFGSDKQIPYINSGGSDFKYDTSLVYDETSEIFSAPELNTLSKLYFGADKYNYIQNIQDASNYGLSVYAGNSKLVDFNYNSWDNARYMQLNGALGFEEMHHDWVTNYDTGGAIYFDSTYDVLKYKQINGEARDVLIPISAVDGQIPFSDLSTNDIIYAEFSHFRWDGNRLVLKEESVNGGNIIGYNAGNGNGTQGTNAFGNYALSSLTSGNYNVAAGSYAGNKLTTGQSNVLLGNHSGVNLVDGDYNVAIGISTGGYSGDYNISIGYAGLEKNTGDYNISLGPWALSENITGERNIAIGAYSGRNSLDNNNTFIGNSAGNSLETGSNNVMIGNKVGYHVEDASSILLIDSIDHWNGRGNATDAINEAIIYGTFNMDKQLQDLHLHANTHVYRLIKKAYYTDKVISGGNTLNYDVSAGQDFNCRAYSSGSINFSNLVEGDSGKIFLTSTGSYTISFSPTAKVSNGGGGIVTTTSNGLDLLTYHYNGTNLFVSIESNFT